jgi:hypothetical protein
MNTLLGAVDNMTDLTQSEVKSELTTMFVKMSLDFHRNDGNFTEEQHKAMAEVVSTFYNGDMVSGTIAETVFHDTYQSVYKKEMNQDEDSENWNGEIDWRKFFVPKFVVVRIATAAAFQDAVDTKAWYKFCSENAERFDSIHRNFEHECN